MNIRTWPAPTIVNLFGLAIASRILIVLLGSLFAQVPLSAAQQAKVSPYAREVDDLPKAPAPWIESWYRFDARHYLRIAVEGYDPRGNRTLFAFLPLLPASMRGAAAAGINIHLAGLLIPNLAFVAGLAAFGRAVLAESQEAATVWKACLLLISFPTAFFYSCPYQESLGFLGISLAILAWRRRRPVEAGCAAAVAGTATKTAPFFSIALLAEWFESWVRRRPMRHSALPVAVLALSGTAAFAVYGYLRTGDPMLIFHVQRAWGREPASVKNLFHVLGESFSKGTINHLVFIGILVLGLDTWRRRGAFWGALVLGPVLFAAGTGTVLSMRRIVLGSFPVCFHAAGLLKNFWLFALIVTLQTGIQMMFLWNYVHGIWVA